MTTSSSDESSGRRTLKATMLPRHVLMLSLGGTIGAGLFIGIAEPLREAGPLGTILGYALSGLVMLATMMCLGELLAAMPHAGSFQYYAYRLFRNRLLSFLIGWMYWFSWVFALAAGLIAGGIVANELLPQVPVWLWSTGFLLILTLINSLSARAFGECEYWLSLIKVLAIVGFIVAGIVLIAMRCQAGETLTLRDPSGAFFPHGLSAPLLCMTVVIYSFQGAEVVGNIAGEAQNPSAVLPMVIKSIGLRIVFFYILSIAVIALLYPNGYQGNLSGPFVAVFGDLGVPSAETLMKLVILSAALSAANSGIYVCSRMIWSMAETGMAPRCFSQLNRHHVPLLAILLCSGLSLVCMLTKSINAERLFIFLLSSTAQVGCAAWIVIALCQLRYRQLVNAGKIVASEGLYRAPWTPWTGRFVILVNLVIILSGWLGTDGKEMFLSEMALLLGLCVAYFCSGWKTHWSHNEN